MSQQTAEHLIDGREVPSLSGRTFESVDPATGSHLADVAFAEEADVDRAVQSAATAFRDGRWCDLPPRERSRRMRRVGALIEANAERLAELESRDSGAPLSKARDDVGAAS